jgi:hypothetical protein
VYLLLDAGSHASHQTRNQAVAVVRLHAHGVKVRYAEGESLEPLYGERFANKAGAFHAKYVLVGNSMIAGSTNWTRASSANRELSVVLRLSPSQDRWARHYFWRAWDGARGAYPTLAPKGDMDRPDQGRRGHYGMERWRSSADPAPYAHEDYDVAHVPGGRKVAALPTGVYGGETYPEVGVPWPQGDETYLAVPGSAQPSGWARQGPVLALADASDGRLRRRPGENEYVSAEELCRWCGRLDRGTHRHGECTLRCCNICGGDHYVLRCPSITPGNPSAPHWLTAFGRDGAPRP